jgi:hypothetical protein
MGLVSTPKSLHTKAKANPRLFPHLPFIYPIIMSGVFIGKEPPPTSTIHSTCLFVGPTKLWGGGGFPPWPAGWVEEAAAKPMCWWFEGVN